MKQSSDKEDAVVALENSQMLSSEKQNSANSLDNSQLFSFSGHQISNQIAASVTDPIGQAQVDIGLEDDALPCKNSDVSIEVNVEVEEEQYPLKESNDKEYKDSSEASLDCESIDESHKNEILASASFDIDGAGLKSSEREGTTCKTLLDEIECDFEVPSVLQSTELASSVVSCENKVAEMVLASSSTSQSTESCFLLEFSRATVPQKIDNTFHNINANMSFSDLSSVLVCSESFPITSCNEEVHMALAFSKSVLSRESNDTSIIGEPVFAPESSGKEHEEFDEDIQLENFTPSMEIGDVCNFTGIADPSLETIDLSDKVKLDDSCVIVDNKLLCPVSCRARKHKSYKKLIQDAFASRKRLTTEYEQLAILYGDIDVECRQSLEHDNSFSIPTTSLASNESLARDLCDSEWEIL